MSFKKYLIIKLIMLLNSYIFFPDNEVMETAKFAPHSPPLNVDYCIFEKKDESMQPPLMGEILIGLTSRQSLL
jgi:hypothetical protein